jgi:hypothetical protein
MDEASYLLENIQLLIGYHNISHKPSLFDGLVNLVPSPVSSVDQVVNLVSSSIEPLTQVVDPVPSSINPTLHMKSDKVVDLVFSLANPTPHSKSEDVAQVYLVNTDSPRQGGTPPIPMAPPSSNKMIYINWNNLT